MSTAYQPLEVEGLQRPPAQPAAPQAQTEAPVIEPPSAAPATDQPATPANQQVSPAIHQPFQAAKDGVTGKILKCGQKPFRFEPDKPESTFIITLRTKNGVQTFWGQGAGGAAAPNPCAARQDGDVAVAGQFSGYRQGAPQKRAGRHRGLRR
nr:hypothetical protein pPsy0462a_00076 [Pseudomonas syringae]